MQSKEPLEDIHSWIKEYKNSSNPKTRSQIKNLITVRCLPLVKKIAYGLARRNTDPIEDIIQIGSVGLLKALEQYSFNEGTSFKTYATYLITGEIRHYIRDKASMIRAPRELQELSYRVNKIIQQLNEELGRQPTDLDIAEYLQIPVNKLNAAYEADRRKQIISLDQDVNSSDDSSQSIVDTITDDHYQELTKLREDRMILDEAIEKLDEKLKSVIKMSYFEDMSQKEIADKLGISQMQVSRRLKKAIDTLFIIITGKESAEKLEV